MSNRKYYRRISRKSTIAIIFAIVAYLLFFAILLYQSIVNKYGVEAIVGCIIMEIATIYFIFYCYRIWDRRKYYLTEEGIIKTEQDIESLIGWNKIKYVGVFGVPKTTGLHKVFPRMVVFSFYHDQSFIDEFKYKTPEQKKHVILMQYDKKLLSEVKKYWKQKILNE